MTRNRVAGEERCEPSEDRRRRRRGQLLAHNRADERGQMVLALTLGQQAWTDVLDGFGEHRIAPHQESSGARVVVCGQGSRPGGHRSESYLIDTVSVTCAWISINP